MSLWSSSAWKILIDSKLRADPLAKPSSIFKTTTVWLICSMMRPATMPSTPGCQPSLAKTWTGLSKSTMLMASSKMFWTTSLRSSFLALISRAMACASSSSNPVNSSIAGFGSSKRPKALSWGAILKATVSSEIVVRSTSEIRSNSWSPIRSVVLRISSPTLTIIRFSSVRLTISAIVPIATKSNISVGMVSRRAVAILKATPQPAKYLKG